MTKIYIQEDNHCIIAKNRRKEDKPKAFTYALTKRQGSQATLDVSPCIVHRNLQSQPFASAI